MANFATVTNNIMADSGITAFQSTSGTSGTSGGTGSIGSSGTAGTSGLSAITGTSGISAVSATSGTSGAGAGSSGLSGASRTSGISGASTASGTSGSSGQSLSGAAGSSGTSGATLGAPSIWLYAFDSNIPAYDGSGYGWIATNSYNPGFGSYGSGLNQRPAGTDDGGISSNANDATNGLYMLTTVSTDYIYTASLNFVSGGRNVYVSGSFPNKWGYLSSTLVSKTNIEDLQDVSWLTKLRPVTYNYIKRDENNNLTDEIENVLCYGLIAEEVELVNDNLVFYDILEDGTKALAGVQYDKLYAPIFAKIQELEKELEILESK